MRGTRAAAAVLAATIAGAAGAQTVVAGGTPMQVALLGSEEAPGPGDPDGSGTAFLRFNQGQGEVCVTFETTGIGPVVGAHIHRAPAGSAGPVVIPLQFPGGCSTADKALIKEIRKDPSAFYVNVHTTEFQPGAIRGQLG